MGLQGRQTRRSSRWRVSACDRSGVDANRRMHSTCGVTLGRKLQNYGVLGQPRTPSALAGGLEQSVAHCEVFTLEPPILKPQNECWFCSLGATWALFKLGVRVAAPCHCANPVPKEQRKKTMRGAPF